MIKVHGLWAHQGTAQKNAAWDRLIEDVRDERANAVLMS
jgi:hypothetical protein